jgi:hypothetical protein
MPPAQVLLLAHLRLLHQLLAQAWRWGEVPWGWKVYVPAWKAWQYKKHQQVQDYARDHVDLREQEAVFPRQSQKAVLLPSQHALGAATSTCTCTSTSTVVTRVQQPWYLHIQRLGTSHYPRFAQSVAFTACCMYIFTHSLCVSFLGTVALNASRSLLMMSQCCRVVTGGLDALSLATSQPVADPTQEYTCADGAT